MNHAAAEKPYIRIHSITVCNLAPKRIVWSLSDYEYLKYFPHSKIMNDSMNSYNNEYDDCVSTVSLKKLLYQIITKE